MNTQDLSQLLTIGFPQDGDLSAIERLQPGGVILFERNAGTRAETRRLTRRIEAASTRERPLVCIDQEGGRVQRLKTDFTPIPSARELAAQGPQAVALMAMNVAAELRAVGIHVNFAPVCDVPIHEGDTVIGNRAFSTDFIEASMCAAEYVRGAQPTVMCVAKHFPGHGAVGVDSHHALPTLASTRDELEEALGPFRAALAAGCGGVMTSHIALPNIDPSGAPASLSQAVTTGLLREELGFRGVVFTDDLEMKALPQDDIGHVAVRAIAAGADMLLVCHDAGKAARVLAALENAISTGELSETRVQDAVNRVRWAKKRFGVLAS